MGNLLGVIGNIIGGWVVECISGLLRFVYVSDGVDDGVMGGGVSSFINGDGGEVVGFRFGIVMEGGGLVGVQNDVFDGEFIVVIVDLILRYNLFYFSFIGFERYVVNELVGLIDCIVLLGKILVNECVIYGVFLFGGVLFSFYKVSIWSDLK